jgi:hypothetical protein
VSCSRTTTRSAFYRRRSRRYDFSKAQLIRPGAAYCVAGKVNSIDKLYLVIESVRLDTKYARSSTTPILLTAWEGYLCAVDGICS